MPRPLPVQITSVLEQTYPHIEYIIIDGGSTDGTLDIIREYKNRISRLVSEPDGGIYEAMNKGIKMATGEVIGILNADDWYTEDTLSTIVTAFSVDGRRDGVYGDLMICDLGGKATILINGAGKNIAHPTMFVKKRVYDRWGLFDTRFKIAADVDSIMRICEQRNFDVTA